MLAKLVQAGIDPSRIDEAARAVEQELIPLFVAHPGACQGYWMANRVTGQVLAMTCWADLEQLEAARAADGKERAAVMARIGVRIHAVKTLTVLGVEESHDNVTPVLRFARATWVEKLSNDHDASLRAMHRDVVPLQVASPGFCASYWLADYETGDGLGLSLWSALPDLRESEAGSRRRRKWFESTVGCKIDLISEYEAVGAVASAAADIIDLTQVLRPPSSPGSTTARPA